MRLSKITDYLFLLSELLFVFPLSELLLVCLPLFCFSCVCCFTSAVCFVLSLIVVMPLVEKEEVTTKNITKRIKPRYSSAEKVPMLMTHKKESGIYSIL